MKRINIHWRDKEVNMSLPAAGVLSAIVTVLDRTDKEPDSTDELCLHLGGLDSTDGMHPHWGDYDLQPGDRITISIHDDRESDPPIERRGLTQEENENSKKDYIRKTAEELGWQIIEPEPNG